MCVVFLHGSSAGLCCCAYIQEQSHQYALTISALEEKLLGLIKRGKGEEGVRQGVEGVGKGDDGRPSRVESSHDADRSREQLESVEKVVAVLRYST